MYHYLPIITGRNEAIHSVHRGGLPQCMLGYNPPRGQPPRSRHTPSWDHTPLEHLEHPPGPPPGPHPPRPPPQTTPPLGHPPEQTHTPLGPHPPGADIQPPGPHPPPPEHPSPTPHPKSRLQHTVYERPVRILLECILVTNSFQILCEFNFNIWPIWIELHVLGILINLQMITVLLSLTHLQQYCILLYK